MSNVKIGCREKKVIDIFDFQSGLNIAREKFQQGNFLEAFDAYEQLAATCPDHTIDLLAELYDCYQLLPKKDRYNLYQARHFNFGIKSSDKVLDIGSGHIPFSLATHLADITFDDNKYGRAGTPFKYVHGKPVFECNIENMPFADKEFDFAYCSHVLEHAQYPEKACKELIRIAKRGYIETPTKGKDIFLNSIRTSGHKWWVETVNGRLIFTEYTTDEINALQCNILMNMHCSPQTKREKAFSALIYLKADLVNTMFLWNEKFEYEVRRFSSGRKNEELKTTATVISDNNEDKKKLIFDIDVLLNQSHKDQSDLLTLAENLIKADYLNEAEQLCNTLIAQYGKTSEIFNMLGYINYKHGKLSDAQKQFEIAYSLNKSDKNAGLNLFKISQKLGHADTAKKVYDMLILTFPTDKDILNISPEITEINKNQDKLNQCTGKKNACGIYPEFFKKTSIASLKFLQVHTFYTHYLTDFYNSNPHIASSSFQEQIDALVKDGFSAVHMFAPYMGDIGYDSHLIIANCPQAQQQWLREHSIVINNSYNWINEIVRKQIEAIQPDILYLSDPITFDSKFTKTLNWKPKLILGWRAANIPETTDWLKFDIILSSLSALRETALQLGARSVEHFYPGFPTWISSLVSDLKPQYDVVFSGQWTLSQHPRRNKYLQEISNAASQKKQGFSLAYYLSGQINTIPPEVAKYNLGGRFGIAMHQALRTGRIAIDGRGILEIKNSSSNAIIDLAGKETANMRIFEVTGSGVFLLTEYHENLKQYFNLGEEIETFMDEKELIEKISHYLDHPEKREEIAKRGQERCLKEYNILNRAKELDNIIRKYIPLKSSNDQHQTTMKVTVTRSTITSCIQNAIDELKAEKFESAFEFLNQAKSLKQPIQGIDFLRAECFLKMNQLHSAREALLEELRFFPNNIEAKNLLNQITKQQPKSTPLLFSDEEFNKLLQVIHPYTMLSNERLYSLFSLAKRACETNIPGNFVECGVAAGGSAALLAYVIKKYSKQPRWLYAFDSFDGMPFPTDYDQHNGQAAHATGWGAGTCAAPEDSVKEICTKLEVSDVLRTIKGDFHDTLPKMRDTTGMIAFLHMDGDWYKSTKAILYNLYDRMVNYGLVQIDDYGYWEGCKRAVHEFEKLRNLNFNLNKVDGTGVWFQKPDTFPVNTVLQQNLVNDFYNSDPAPKGLISQMSTNERFQLYYILRNLLFRKDASPLRFIEIGSYAGASLFLIYMAIKKITSRIQGFAIEPGSNAQLNDVIKVIGNEVNLLPVPSQQAAPHLLQLFKRDNNFAEIIFIDGNHTCEGVRQDIMNYFPILAPGGIMVFHDYLPPLNKENRDAILFHHAGNEPGVRQACQELMEETFHCEILNIPLLYPTDPTQTQAHLPIIPGVFSTIRAYRKSIT